MEHVDCIVAGAGVVGLAIARELTAQGRDVLVLEAAGRIGSGTSSRNSEVIHAGIYYAANSLMAQLCGRGRALLYAYCTAHHVPHRRIGKLIVATDAGEAEKRDGIRTSSIGIIKKSITSNCLFIFFVLFGSMSQDHVIKPLKSTASH